MFAVLTCNPALFVLGLVSENRFTTHFFVSTVDKETVTSCKFAMQAEEMCVNTSVKFDQCSVFESLHNYECPIIDGGRK